MNHPALILIVDDDWMNRELLEVYLGAYEVLSAHSGPKALELAHQRSPDLVVADVRMPEMDGYELCAHLRAEDATRETPILMMSGLNDEESKQKAFDAGADDILSKPFDVQTFLARVRLLLRLKKLQDELKQRKSALGEALKQHLDEASIRAVMDAYLKADV